MDRRTFIELGLGLGALGTTSAWATQARTPLRLVYFDAAEPISWRDDKGVMQGLLVDTLDEALKKRMKIELSHDGYPWARAQLMVKQGSADAFCTIPTPERLTYAVASTEPVATIPLVMYAKVDGKRLEELKKVRTVEDLRSFSHVSYIGAGWAKKNLVGVDVDYVPKIEDCLRILARGEADLYIDNRASTQKYLRALGLQKQIVELPHVLENTYYHLCIGKESPYVDILPAFDKVMAKLKSDGTLAAITGRHIPK